MNDRSSESSRHPQFKVVLTDCEIASGDAAKNTLLLARQAADAAHIAENAAAKAAYLASCSAADAAYVAAEKNATAAALAAHNAAFAANLAAKAAAEAFYEYQRLIAAERRAAQSDAEN